MALGPSSLVYQAHQIVPALLSHDLNTHRPNFFYHRVGEGLEFFFGRINDFHTVCFQLLVEVIVQLNNALAGILLSFFCDLHKDLLIFFGQGIPELLIDEEARYGIGVVGTSQVLLYLIELLVENVGGRVLLAVTQTLLHGAEQFVVRHVGDRHASSSKDAIWIGSL